MKDFAAIDFETANGRRSSVCSVGIAIVREGKIAERIYSLIRPNPNYYTEWTTEIHGLTRVDTDYADKFPIVWDRIRGRIEGLPLVAHNRMFDESCLKAVHALYGMDYPGYEFYCTLAASRRCLRLPNHRLHTVSAACGFNLEHHHNAIADAEACAAIAIHLCSTFGDEAMFGRKPRGLADWL